MNKNIHSVPALGHSKEQTVGTNRIVIMRNMRRLRVLGCKFIVAVDVNWYPITLDFPVGRNLYFFPLAVIIAWQPEISRNLGRLWHPVKLPLTVK
jgi:hypothetical protein